MQPVSASLPHTRSAGIPAGQRIYAIGDVHGRMDLLERLIARIVADHQARGEADAEIILLGDLIDRGPDSADVVAWAMEGKAGALPVSTLMGNHEEQLVDSVLGEGRLLEGWLTYGGLETLRSYGVDPRLLTSGDSGAIREAARAAVPAAIAGWMEALPVHRRTGDYLLVHAGVRPGVALHRQNPRDMRWIRGEFLDSDSDHGAIVVHGHSIRPEVEIRHNRIGLDTGAYRSGRLSAIGLEGSARWVLQT